MSAVLIPSLPDRVDELERQLQLLRDTPEDTISTTNDFFINAGGQVQGPGGEGLSTFIDTFDSPASYANYDYPFTTRAELEAKSTPTPLGLQINAQLGEPEQLFMLLKAFQDPAGRNRCIDHISILKYTTGLAGERAHRIGNLARFREGEGAFQAWHSRIEGLDVFHEYTSLNTSAYYWVKAKEQQIKQYGGVGLEGKVKWPIALWLMSCTLNQEVVSTLWASDPFKGGAPLVRCVPSVAALGVGNIEEQFSGVVTGTPTDIGIGLIGPNTGDVLNEWTCIPLSWR